MKKAWIKACVSLVFLTLIAAFPVYAHAEIAVTSLAPTESRSVPEEREVQYLVWHHPVQCIKFIGPISRTVCVLKSSLSYAGEEKKTFSAVFCEMLMMRHDNAVIPLTSWLQIESVGKSQVAVYLSDGYNEPFAVGQGKTFSGAMENLFFNFFHQHGDGERKTLSKTKE